LLPSRIPTVSKNTGGQSGLRACKQDVECTFGILKGQWQILKSGIRVSGHRATGTIWKTFCEELGQFEMANLHAIPQSIRQCLSAAEFQAYDSSCFGCATSCSASEGSQCHITTTTTRASCGGIRIMRNLTHTQFRACLVEHFNILAVSKKQNQMALPTTNKRAMAAATTPRIGSNRGRR
jgi:hypothetical protein